MESSNGSRQNSKKRQINKRIVVVKNLELITWYGQSRPFNSFFHNLFHRPIITGNLPKWTPLHRQILLSFHSTVRPSPCGVPHLHVKSPFQLWPKIGPSQKHSPINLPISKLFCLIGNIFWSLFKGCNIYYFP